MSSFLVDNLQREPHAVVVTTNTPLLMPKSKYMWRKVYRAQANKGAKVVTLSHAWVMIL